MGGWLFGQQPCRSSPRGTAPPPKPSRRAWQCARRGEAHSCMGRPSPPQILQADESQNGALSRSPARTQGLGGAAAGRKTNPDVRPSPLPTAGAHLNTPPPSDLGEREKKTHPQPSISASFFFFWNGRVRKEKEQSDFGLNPVPPRGALMRRRGRERGGASLEES